LPAPKIAFWPTRDKKNHRDSRLILVSLFSFANQWIKLGYGFGGIIPAKFFFAKASKKSRRSLGEGGPYRLSLIEGQSRIIIYQAIVLFKESIFADLSRIQSRDLKLNPGFEFTIVIS